jgi:hypothetical protein
MCSNEYAIIGKCHGFSIFIEDLSQRAWIFLLEENSLALDVLRKFTTTIEEECARKVRGLQ